MDIRPMRAADLPAVAALYLAAYGVEWPGDGPERYVAKFFHFDPERCLVAVEGAAIVGAILGYSFEKETGVTLFIQELMVDPTTRSQGTGKRLVAALRESVGGPSQVKIKPLVKADTSVLNFYNSLGFERDKVVSFSLD